jgi:hypothetical protein
MNKINVELAGLALMAAIATMAGTLATTGAPLLAETPGAATAGLTGGADLAAFRPDPAPRNI